MDGPGVKGVDIPSCLLSWVKDPNLPLITGVLPARDRDTQTSNSGRPFPPEKTSVPPRQGPSGRATARPRLEPEREGGSGSPAAAGVRASQGSAPHPPGSPAVGARAFAPVAPPAPSRHRSRPVPHPHPIGGGKVSTPRAPRHSRPSTTPASVPGGPPTSPANRPPRRPERPSARTQTPRPSGRPSARPALARRDRPSRTPAPRARPTSDDDGGPSGPPTGVIRRGL